MASLLSACPACLRSPCVGWGTDSTLLSTGATARLRSKHACEAQTTHKCTHAQVMDKVHIGPDSAHTRHVDPRDPSQRFKRETAPDRTYGSAREYIPALSRTAQTVLLRDRNATCHALNANAGAAFSLCKHSLCVCVGFFHRVD